MPLYRRAAEIDESLEDAHNLQVDLSNLAVALRDIGGFREAVGALLRALVLNRELKNPYPEAITLRNLGHSLCPTDGHDFGRVALGRHRRVFLNLHVSELASEAAACLAQYLLWLGDISKAGRWAESAWGFATHQALLRDYIHSALMQGEAALGMQNLPRAEERLHGALTRARTVNLVELELPALIALARLALQRGQLAEAKAHLEDVWDSTERGPYPLNQADAYNVLAAIARAEGDAPAAVAAATRAYHSAWCDGPPYAYHWGLEAAKAHLAALGAPEPVMPPFDESKFEPLPEVEINPKDEFWFDPDSSD